jgi:membrane-associated phospholipid phosphatase
VARADVALPRWSRLSIVVVATAVPFAIADALGIPHSRIVIAPGTASHFVTVMAVLGAAAASAAIVQRRMRTKSTRFAAFLDAAAEGVVVVAWAGLLFTPLSLAAGIFMYMAAAMGWPLGDATLAAIDRALGFDWPSVLRALDHHPLLATILSRVYHTTGPQIPIVFLVLGFAGRRERLLEYLALIGVSSLFTGAATALVPAVGAHAFFHPARDAFSHFTADAGMWHYEELMRLRSGRPFLYDVTRTQGLVTFPSYHAVLAIITSYAMRGVRHLALPVALLNAVVVVSTIPEGGHYLIDVLAGIVVAALSIPLVGDLVGREAPDARPRAALYRPPRRG